MGIINRDKDVSEKRQDFCRSLQSANTGSTLTVLCAPWPATIDQIVVTAVGISGTPVLTPIISRFIVGTGATAIASAGAALTCSEFGTSGPVGMSLVAQSAANASLLDLKAGDIVSLVVSGANSAVAALTVNVVLKSLQSIKSHYGLSGMIGSFVE